MEGRPNDEAMLASDSDKRVCCYSHQFCTRSSFFQYVGAVSMIVLVACVNSYRIEAQTRDSAKRNSELATRQIKDVALEGQLGNLLTRLSLDYDIPIGLEISSDEQKSNHYRVELSEGTIADLMGQIISQNERSDWMIENGVVNVFPRDKYRDGFLTDLPWLPFAEELFAVITLDGMNAPDNLHSQNMVWQRYFVSHTIEQKGLLEKHLHRPFAQVGTNKKSHTLSRSQTAFDANCETDRGGIKETVTIAYPARCWSSGKQLQGILVNY